MGKLGRALAGGIAGAAGAAGDVFKERAKSKEYDRRSELLTKREAALTKLRNDFTLERDKSQAGQQADVIAEGRIYKEGILAEDRGYKEGVMTEERAYQKGEKTSDREARQEDALELQRLRNQGRSMAKPDKVTAADKKYAKNDALAGIESKFSTYDVMFDPASKSKIYELNVAGKPQKEIDALLTYIDSKGFQFDGSQPDKDTLVISLGEFDYEKYQGSSDSIAKPVYADVEEKQNTFDQLKAALDKQTGRSKVNAEQGNFKLERGGGIGAPVPNTALPAY